ncbi:MAG: wax ester/triacylglycerol synthase family O-acyltransferase [Actinomycetota bacterium]|nr:wax ester/triacylglycerol synthase family O-acyltransferase [Actinomycetota bacterium]
MTGLDASFLYFETPSMHMHVLGTLVLDPSASPEPWSVSAVRDLVVARMDLLAPFRRRLLPSALRLHHPVWVDVNHVDVDAHMSYASCPSPGGMTELAGVVAEFSSRKLDRSRPLWEILVVDGLDRGRVAVVIKIHHSAVDGVGAAEILGNLFDLVPSGRTDAELAQARTLAAAEHRPEPGMAGRLVHSVTGLASRPWQVVRLVPTVVQAVTKLVQVRTGEGGPSGGAVPFVAPRAPFNGRITPDRVVAFTDVPLADVKAVKSAVGGTFNDVVIALCGGAFRRYLADRGELPDSSLIAVVPVSVRSAEVTTGANQVSAMFTTLATDVADPLERLDVVRQANNAGKADHEAVGASLVSQAAELAPPTFTGFIARAYSALRVADLHPVVHNVVISNVAGPPVQIYFAGAAIEGLYPLGPVLEGPGLNITVVSYRDRVGFGFIACAERLPDLADLAAAVQPALAELLVACAAGPETGHQ